MSNDNNASEDVNLISDSENQEKKDFLLNPENFERLMKIQREIELETEMRPTFKKLINALVTEDALNDVKLRMIERMNLCS